MDTMEDAIRELYFYKKGTAGGFATQLFDLIGKADVYNRVKIARGFPEVIKAYLEWQSSPNEAEFFKSYGLGE